MLQEDWNPKSDAVLDDQRRAYDEMRERCPVAYSDLLGWTLFRHEDIARVLNDPGSFSNVVSKYLSIPDGMDPPQHTAYRSFIEPYFRPDAVAAFEPQCRAIAVNLVQSLLEREEAEVMGEFADWFAVRIQCSFLGWPAEMHAPLRLWTKKNHEATFAQDRVAMTKIASEFAGYVDALLQLRRATDASACDDITASLSRGQVNGRPLRDEEIVSILRNWTVGEVSTISAAVGILIQYVSEHADLQQELRADPSLLHDTIEEILRLHGPLAANRRVTTCPMEIGGREIGASERISVNWISANRDGRVFEEPEAFRPARDQSKNLLYGAGIHVCPGAGLARMELRVVMQELLARTSTIKPVPGKPATAARFPASGFATVPILVR